MIEWMTGWMFIIVPLAFWPLSIMWVRIVVYRGTETLQIMKKITSDPGWIADYEFCKQLCERTNGPGSWKRTVDSAQNLMDKHLRWNTIGWYVLLFFSTFVSLVRQPGLQPSLLFTWVVLCVGYAGHLVYIEYYNRENREYYKKIQKSWNHPDEKHFEAS